MNAGWMGVYWLINRTKTFCHSYPDLVNPWLLLQIVQESWRRCSCVCIYRNRLIVQPIVAFRWRIRRCNPEIELFFASDPTAVLIMFQDHSTSTQWLSILPLRLKGRLLYKGCCSRWHFLWWLIWPFVCDKYQLHCCYHLKLLAH